MTRTGARTPRSRRGCPAPFATSSIAATRLCNAFRSCAWSSCGSRTSIISSTLLANPIGSVYRTRDPNIRTVGRGQFKQLLAQLTHGARRIDGTVGPGRGLSEAGWRYGERALQPGKQWPDARYRLAGWSRRKKIHKVHFQSHINWKGFNLMQKAQFFPEYSDVQHALIRYHAVQNIEFGNMTKNDL